VIDLDAALGEQLLNITVGQALPQIPPHRDRDHLAREPIPGRSGRQARPRGDHPIIVLAPASPNAKRPADVVSFVSLAPNTTQMATELYTYKRMDIDENIRRFRQVGLAAVLWKWLALHEKCMARHVGATQFDLITTVPGTGGRTGTQPLEDLVSKVVVGSGARYAPMLALGASAVAHRGFAADRFATTTSAEGRSVLIIDDTWTRGAHAQSAAAALKVSGPEGWASSQSADG
jgi:predicted amidophosphoribosyltransferase